MNGENVITRSGGIAVSLAIHLLFLLLVWQGAPVIASLLAPLGSRTQPPTPTVVTFRMGDVVADVAEASRVDQPPPTEITGRHNSRAADLVPGNEDTPVPAGGVTGLDNSIPGTGALEESPGAAGAAADAAAARGTAEAANEAPRDEGSTPKSTETDGMQASLRDALTSSEQMLTGKRVNAARPGYGARRSGQSEDVGALAFGEYAFSTRAWDYEPYWVSMRAKLYAAWHPPVAYTQYGILHGGSTVVRVTVHKDGTISDPQILQTDGHESLHRSSLAAMLGAAPFRPLPEDFPDPELVVTVRFVYMPPGAARNAP